MLAEHASRQRGRIVLRQQADLDALSAPFARNSSVRAGLESAWSLLVPRNSSLGGFGGASTASKRQCCRQVAPLRSSIDDQQMAASGDAPREAPAAAGRLSAALPEDPRSARRRDVLDRGELCEDWKHPREAASSVRNCAVSGACRAGAPDKSIMESKALLATDSRS